MKYIGSKSAIVKFIAPVIQAHLTDCSEYIEPFVGGANSIVRLRHSRRLGSDSNAYVIALLVALRDGWTPPDVTRDEYNAIRADRDAFEPALVGWAGVGCSYSGKWFGGYAGQVQTKGGVRDYIAEARRNCLAQAPLLRGIAFRHQDFTSLDPVPGSVIYCDPPYANTLKYPGEFDTEKFWLWCREMSGFNTVLVSEYSAPEGWLEIWRRDVGSSLSANGKVGGRKVSTEKLFVLDPSQS